MTWYDENPTWLEHTERPGMRQWVRAYFAAVHDHEICCFYELEDIGSRNDPRDVVSMAIREELQKRGLSSRPCEADVPEPWEQMHQDGTMDDYLRSLPELADFDPSQRSYRPDRLR